MHSLARLLHKPLFYSHSGTKNSLIPHLYHRSLAPLEFICAKGHLECTDSTKGIRVMPRKLVEHSDGDVGTAPLAFIVALLALALLIHVLQT